jgi:hypothetical protein
MGMMGKAGVVTTAALVVAVVTGCASESQVGSVAGAASTKMVIPAAASRPPAEAASMVPSPPSATASGTTAAGLCRTALGQPGTATMVTVAEVRDYATGPAAKSAPDAFPSADPADPAAWCWVHASTLNIAYAVHAGDKAVRMVAEGGAGVTTELMTGIPHFP